MKNYLSCTSFVISKQGNSPRDETPTMEIFQEQELPLSNISISLKTSSKVGKQEQEPHLKPENLKSLGLILILTSDYPQTCTFNFSQSGLLSLLTQPLSLVEATRTHRNILMVFCQRRGHRKMEVAFNITLFSTTPHSLLLHMTNPPIVVLARPQTCPLPCILHIEF